MNVYLLIVYNKKHLKKNALDASSSIGNRTRTSQLKGLGFEINIKTALFGHTNLGEATIFF